jgi:hypothetical protein
MKTKVSRRDKIVQRLLNVKSVLPFNGDWLFATESLKPKDPDERDLAAEFSDYKVFLREMHTTDLPVLQVIYERAKAYSDMIHKGADSVRTRAIAILSASSFVSAIILFISSLLISLKDRGNRWVTCFLMILFLGTVWHLVRSLLLSVDVVQKETLVEVSPLDISNLGSYNEACVGRLYKELSAQLVANASQSQDFIRKKANRLILGQCELRWGVGFFVTFLFLSVGLSIFHTKPDAIYDLVKSQNTKFDALVRTIERTADQQTKAIESLKTRTEPKKTKSTAKSGK